MAKLEGISGMQMGDGASGNIALDLKTRVLRIIMEGGFTYQTATLADPQQVNAGSVSYQVPEILQAEDYNPSGDFQKINSGLITVPINIRRSVRYSYETFDYSRLGDMAYVVSVIANSVAMTIQNDLNLHFWLNLAPNFNKTTGALKAQTVAIPKLTEKGATQDDIRKAIYELQWKTTEINKTWSKLAMGVPKSELMIYLDTFADVNIRQAFWNQPNELGKRVIAKDLVGYPLGGGIFYYLDKMIGATINAGQSFSKDKTLDLKDYVGFIIHNEAVAMPFNLNQMIQVLNPVSGNPQWIAKYQFGFGLVRPWLIYAITKTDHTTAAYNGKSKG